MSDLMTEARKRRAELEEPEDAPMVGRRKTPMLNPPAPVPPIVTALIAALALVTIWVLFRSLVPTTTTTTDSGPVAPAVAPWRPTIAPAPAEAPPVEAPAPTLVPDAPPAAPAPVELNYLEGQQPAPVFQAAPPAPVLLDPTREPVDLIPITTPVPMDAIPPFMPATPAPAYVVNPEAMPPNSGGVKP
jgi:hypothetical protein